MVDTFWVLFWEKYGKTAVFPGGYDRSGKIKDPLTRSLLVHFLGGHHLPVALQRTSAEVMPGEKR